MQKHKCTSLEREFVARYRRSATALVQATSDQRELIYYILLNMYTK